MQDGLLDLAYEVSRVTEEKVGAIEDIMRRTGILAINARLEAARAGPAGNAFAVVAQEVGAVAQAIRGVSAELRTAIADNVARLGAAGRTLRFEMRGARLTDLARNAIEIIDRNLYERSCDVRWWATDSAIVDLLAASGDAAALRRHACSRLATILRSYTVYLDLWVADAAGRVVATGRSDRYGGVIGADVSSAAWFRNAMRTRDGTDFHVAGIERQPLLDRAAALAYATAVRRGGETFGEPLGALGIFFDWAPQAAAIVDAVHGSANEEDTRVMLLDRDGRVTACSGGTVAGGTAFSLRSAGGARGHYGEGGRLVAFALTPGYETYEGLGWYGCIDAPLAQGGG